MQSLAIAILVVSMMLAVGLQVPPAALREVLRARRLLAGVLAVNLLVVPACALALTVGVAMPPAAAAAILLCATAPGGPLGPVLTGLAAADLPLATGVMIVLALVSVVATPVLAAVLLPSVAGTTVGTGPLFWTVLVFQLLPLAGGMAVRQRWPGVAARYAPLAARMANGALAAVVLGLVVTRAGILLELGTVSLVGMTAFVVVSLLAGGALGDRPAQGHALALCTGVRNLALALLVAAAHLRDPAVDAALLSFGFLMLACPALLALYWRRVDSARPHGGRADGS